MRYNWRVTVMFFGARALVPVHWLGRHFLARALRDLMVRICRTQYNPGRHCEVKHAEGCEQSKHATHQFVLQLEWPGTESNRRHADFQSGWGGDARVLEST